MSYILDALKKSEKERALGNIPSLETGSQSGGKRVPLSWFLVLIVTLVAAGTWSVWRNAQTTSRIVDRQAGEEAMTAQPSAQNIPVEVQTKPPAAVGEPGLTGGGVVEPEPVIITDLDPSVRSRLPDLSINALSYSENKSRRFVMINQNIYKEGETISGGAVVQEILRSRVILSLDDIRFAVLP